MPAEVARVRPQRQDRAGLEAVLARMEEWAETADYPDGPDHDPELDALEAALAAADAQLDDAFSEFCLQPINSGIDKVTASFVAWRRAKQARWRVFLKLLNLMQRNLPERHWQQFDEMQAEAVANIAPALTVWEFDRSTGRMTATVILDVDHDLAVEFVLVDRVVSWSGLTVTPVDPSERLPSWRWMTRSGVGAVLDELARDLMTPDVLWMCPPEWTEASMVGRPGRAGTPDHVHALWAARYVAALAEDPRRPVQVMVGHYRDPEHGGCYSTSSMTAKVNKARDKGFLTAAPPGRAGGELTQKAHDALSDQYGNRLPAALIYGEGDV